MMKIFDPQAEYVLEDDVALLRPLRESDIPALLPFSLSEPDLWTYSLINAAGRDALKSYVKQALEDRKRAFAYPFVVFDKRTDACAGTTRLYDIQPANRTTQLGYTWFGKKFWGTGLNKHSKFLMLQWVFEDLQFERVEFRADAGNARSIAAMKSLGCVPEGVLRSNGIRPDGTRRDSAVLSMLRSEWLDHSRKNLLNKISK